MAFGKLGDGGRGFGHLGTALGRAGTSPVQRPSFPFLTWVSASTDTTPDFNVDLPSGNGDYRDAAAGDHLILEYQLQSGGSWTTYVDRTLSSGDISSDTISVTGISSIADGSYFFRARIVRGAIQGTNSTNVAVTIAATPSTVTISYGATGSNNTSQTSYSFSGLTVPATGSKVYPVVALSMRSSSAISTPTVTVDFGSGPVAFVLIAGTEAKNGSGPAGYTSFFMSSTPVTAGSTATVAISAFGAAAARAAASLYMVTTATPTPAGTATDIVNANPTTTKTVPSNGGIIAAAHGASATASSMTNLTQDASVLISGTTNVHAVGHDTSHAGVSTAYTITLTAVTSDTGSFVYWGP
jgi:hypothetical protein